jgi:hypothetical protein
MATVLRGTVVVGALASLVSTLSTQAREHAHPNLRAGTSKRRYLTARTAAPQSLVFLSMPLGLYRLMGMAISR